MAQEMIKIQLKSIQLTIEPIEVQQDETIETLSDFIDAVCDIEESDILTFFYNGKNLLDRNKTFRYYSIKDGDSIIVRKSKVIWISFSQNK